MRGLHAFVLAAVVGCGVAVAPPGARAQDDEEEDDAPAGDEGTSSGPQLDDAALRARLEPLVHLPSVNVRDGVVTLAYPLGEPIELDAFETTGFDKVDLRNVQGQAQSGVGMELGAGSRAVGRLLHKVPLRGDVDITVELWIAHNTPSAFVCFVIADKVGVLWGQQLVKPSNMRPYGRGTAADPTQYREERSVRSTFAVRGDEVTVTSQGRETSRYTFTKNELRTMRFGILARNVRLVLTDLQIRGQVDVGRLR